MSGSTSEVYCMKCLEENILNTAEFYCVTCKSYLCTDCNKLLHVTSLKLSMKHHHIQDVKTAIVIVDMKGMDICNIHNERFEFYCKKHDELCCKQCKTISHSTCSQLDEIDKVAKHSFNSMLNPVAEINQLQRQIEAMEMWMTSMEDKITKQFKKLPLKLQKKRNKMLEAFDKKAKLLERNAEEIHNEKMDSISKNRSQFIELDRKSEQAKRSLEQIESTGTVAHRFIARHYLNRRFKTFVKSFDDIKEMYENANEIEDFPSIESITDDLEPLSVSL